MNRLVAAVVLAMLATAAPAGAQTPLVDVKQMRESINSQYTARKRQIATDVVKDPATGDVQTDAAAYAGKTKSYQQIQNDVRQLDAERRQMARQLESTRSDELGSLAKTGGVDPGTLKDTGTAPGETASRGIAGDRDITLGTVGDVNKVAAAARAKGYHVTYGEGYVKIKELDTVVWDPPKSRGLSESVAAAHDVEFAPAKTVTAQIKKGLPYMGNPPKPGASEAEIREWAQNVSKSVLKAGQVTGADPATLDVFARIKSDQDLEGLLYPVDASPAEKARALQQLNDQAVSQLGNSYRKSQANSQGALQKLNEQIAQAERAGNDGDARALRQQRTSTEQNEALTQALLYKKNPELMYEMQHNVRLKPRHDAKTGNVWFDASDGRRVTQEDILANKDAMVKRLTRSVQPGEPLAVTPGPSTGTKAAGWAIFGFGALFGTYHAYETERQTAEAERRDISWGSVGLRGVLNVLGVNGAIQAGQALGYETQQGVAEYVQRELGACRPPACDPEDPDFRRLLLLKAIARGTFWGTYEAVKGFPLLGDFVGAPETYINVMRASEGYEDAYSEQLAAEFINATAQAETAAGALEAGRRLGAELTRLAAEAEASLARLTRLAATADALDAQAIDAGRTWTADDDAVRRVCEEIQAFLATQAGSSHANDGPQVVTRLTVVTGEAGPVCQATDRALADLRSGAINAQGVAFRVENGVRAPLTRAGADYNAARPAAEALTASWRQAEALIARLTQANAAAAQHTAQAGALAQNMASSAAVIDAEVNGLMAASRKFDLLRGKFFDAARHFYSSSADELFKFKLRQVAATVSTPTFDQAAALRFSRRAQELRTMATQVASLAGKPHPPCAALPAFVAARDRLKAAAAPTEAALARATEAVTNGRACLARATAAAGLAKALDEAIAGVEQAQKPPAPPAATAAKPESSPKVALSSQTLSEKCNRYGGMQLAAEQPPGDSGAEHLFWEKSANACRRMYEATGQLPDGIDDWLWKLGSRTSVDNRSGYLSRIFTGYLLDEKPLHGRTCKGDSDRIRGAGSVCPHGTDTGYYESGKKTYEVQRVDGWREGVMTEWYESYGGHKMREGPMLHDKPHGAWTYWNDKNVVSGRYQYENGAPVSWENYTFFPNGSLYSIERCTATSTVNDGGQCKTEHPK